MTFIHPTAHDQNQPFAIKKCRHGMMAFNRNDTFIGQSLFQYGEWCEFEIELLSKVMRYGGTAIDVGANIGTHSVALAKSATRIYAFEPQPRLYRLLTANLALNGIQNVVPERVAVGDHIGFIPMADLPPDEAMFNFGAVPLSHGEPKGEARIITVDYLGIAPTLIKIDVEGMEPDVIRGAHKTIERHQPTLYLENNGFDDSSKVASALDEIGYRAWWSIGPYYNPANFFANPICIWVANVAPSANLIAVPRSSGISFDLPEFLGADDVWWKAEKRGNSRGDSAGIVAVQRDVNCSGVG